MPHKNAGVLWKNAAAETRFTKLGTFGRQTRRYDSDKRPKFGIMRMNVRGESAARRKEPEPHVPLTFTCTNERATSPDRGGDPIDSQNIESLAFYRSATRVELKALEGLGVVEIDDPAPGQPSTEQPWSERRGDDDIRPLDRPSQGADGLGIVSHHGRHVDCRYAGFRSCEPDLKMRCKDS